MQLSLFGGLDWYTSWILTVQTRLTAVMFVGRPDWDSSSSSTLNYWNHNTTSTEMNGQPWRECESRNNNTKLRSNQLDNGTNWKHRQTTDELWSQSFLHQQVRNGRGRESCWVRKTHLCPDGHTAERETHFINILVIYLYSLTLSAYCWNID